MKTTTLLPLTLAGILLAGCLDPSAARMTGIFRYQGGEPGEHGNNARGDAYVACTVEDNSSFEALDACMAAKGYTRKDK